MADTINNFVNFLTDKIEPVVIRDYINGVTEEEAKETFGDSDSSTKSFTKIAWHILVAEKMQSEGLPMDGIKEGLELHNEGAGGSALETKSVDNFNLLQQIVLFHLGEKDFTLDTVVELYPSLGEFGDHGFELDFAQMNLTLIAAQAGMYRLVVDIFSRTTNPERVAHHFKGNETSVYLFLLKKRVQIKTATTEKEALILAAFRSANSVPYRKMLYGEMPREGQLDQGVKNKLGGVLCKMKIEELEIAVEETADVIANEQSSQETIAPTVKYATGFGEGEIEYENGSFESYGHLHLAILSFGEEIGKRPDVLHELVSMKGSSWFGAGQIDGLSAFTTLSSFLILLDEGEWNFKLPDFNKGADIEAYARYGNVKDLTRGEKSNNLGAVSWVLNQFRTYHAARYEESDKTTTPNGLPGIESVFGRIVSQQIRGISFSFYVSWCIYFNKEIS